MLMMIIIAVIVLIVLAKVGVFRKPDECKSCGMPLKGTEQKVFGKQEHFVLCKSCASKIHPQILDYAMSNWNYSEYLDYLEWEKETKDERAQFTPDYSYGYGTKLFVDTERGLFSLGSGKKDDLVLRITDLKGLDMDFKPAEMKEGLLGTKVKGDEFVAVELTRPSVYLEKVLNHGVSLSARKKGVFSSKYEYSLSDRFTEIIRAFTICIYINANNEESYEQDETRNIGEIEKAMALFMFDSMDEITTDNLKKQRNALIKTFHPDNNESNETYSQKINAAYELLSNVIARNKAA